MIIQKMIERLNKLTSRQVFVIIIAAGLIVFSSGFGNPFQGDDFGQIINNTPVHSITNIKTFFDGGTFYAGQGQKLSGTYFRPLMLITFSLIYTLFGPHALYFHLFQFALFIASAFLLYLVFSFSFKPPLSLLLATIFLVQPMNSEEVFAIPVMQDTLYFFFGILGIYTLFRFESVKGLTIPALCFALALLSKETGGLFLIMAVIFLFWWDRKRLLPFLGMAAPLLVIYLLLRHHAVGTFSNPNIAPIDVVSLHARILTMPSIFLFYITKFIFPWHLSINYFWVDKTFTFSGVLLPLLTDLVILGAFIGVGLFIKRRETKAMLYTYLFFSVWFAIGMLMNLQLLPLDCTACEPWFIFSMAGLLGMIGVTVQSLHWKISPTVLGMALLLVLALLGFRTAMRGLDWRNQYTLAAIDIQASPDNYIANNLLASLAFKNNNYTKAQYYEYRSYTDYPSITSAYFLGQIEGNEGNYVKAGMYFKQVINNGPGKYYQGAYENISVYLLDVGSPKADEAFDQAALQEFPEDSEIWTNYALLEKENGNTQQAGYALSKVAQYGSVSPSLEEAIVYDQLVTLNLPGEKSVTI